MKHISIIFRLFLTFLFFSIIGFASAQKLQIESIQVATTDLSALTHSRNDLNGNPCALVKVVLTVPNATFTGNIGDVKREGSEYWVYLPKGTKRVQIKHPNYETLAINFSDFGIEALESNTTYNILLSLPSLSSQTLPTSQYLLFKVNPIDALVEVNGDCWVNNNGIARKFVPLGNYNYIIQSKDYHTATGSAVVNDPNNKKVVTINLLPAFGTFEIPFSNELKGASVYLDNKLIGQIPIKESHVASGSHYLRIVKSMYKTKEEEVIIKDNQTTTVIPQLEANFANVTLKVENNAEIWVNEEKKGTSRWSGNLELGNNLIETRLSNHRSFSQNMTITPAMSGQVISLSAPTPIYGSINFNVLPDGATIKIDDKVVGETPMFLSQVLIGSHNIDLAMNGYLAYSKKITVDEGRTTEVECTLSINQKHEYVDLGLPSGTLWATCNVGASKPEEHGDYFAWGETTPQSQNIYAWTSYKWFNDTETIMKYCTNSDYGAVDNKIELETSDDAAYVNWGSAWRMPTSIQFQELINYSYTNTAWIAENGVFGLKITSKANGNSIFLPAVGYRGDSSFDGNGYYGEYWTRSLSLSCSGYAYYLYFNSNSISWNGDSRCYGLNVRPVFNN